MVCPKCESKKVEKMGKLMFFFIPFLSASVFFWISLIMPFFWFVTIGLLLISPLAFFMPKSYNCKECSHVWNDKKSKNKNVLAN